MLFKSVLMASSLLFSSIVTAEAVWIDVRSAAEKKVNGIEGDIRITHTDILSQLTALYPDKDTEINLYCRSGYRANVAKSILTKAGYVNIANLGSIENARKERGISK